jgi:hypothetical protein
MIRLVSEGLPEGVDEKMLHFLDWLQLHIIDDQAVEKTFDLMSRAGGLDVC